jgi:hypothetical protein
MYDKRLYDRLRDGHAGPVRDHLRAGVDFQNKLARFLENHDEPRAAATFPSEVHEAAAVVTYLAPGLRFFHQGQFEGRLAAIAAAMIWKHAGCIWIWRRGVTTCSAWKSCYEVLDHGTAVKTAEFPALSQIFVCRRFEVSEPCQGGRL